MTISMFDMLHAEYFGNFDETWEFSQQNRSSKIGSLPPKYGELAALQRQI
jgi:hypothetical protein